MSNRLTEEFREIRGDDRRSDFMTLSFNTGIYADFAAAASDILAFLQRRLGFDLWMVTRTEGDDWVVLESRDNGYGVGRGDVFAWADSFCSRMVSGEGPRIAPRSAAIPAYAEAPIARKLSIGAYVGQPLTRPDGSLFGTLCAIHPTALPDSIAAESELLEVVSRVLSTLLHREFLEMEQLRRLERIEAEASVDPLTGLYNRGGWNSLLRSEDERRRQFGAPSAVLLLDLDDLKRVNDRDGHLAGDSLIVRTADTLRTTLRKIDIAARWGGDEFAALLVECDRHDAQTVAGRLRDALETADIRASIGLSAPSPNVDLTQAVADADRAMFAEKQRRKGRAWGG